VLLGLTAPLEFLWPKVQSHLGRLPVQVELMTGTLWQGQARVKIPQVGKVTGQWDIQISDLLTGQLAVKVDLVGDELKFNGIVRATAEKIEVGNIEALMSSGYLAPLLRQGKSSLSGEFELNNFNGVFSLSDKKILAVDGRILFTGGDVSFPIDGKTISSKLPILIGVIEKTNENVEVAITNTDGQAIGDGYIQPDGWSGISIRRRFLDILGQKWPADVDEEAVIFEVSQKLF
jgi:general secretion pathway protein N